MFYELNLDGLVGPTHHYGGLGCGNLASEYFAKHTANPKAAALQGLQKMRFLHLNGIQQAVLPPHARPNLKLLRTLGFEGMPHAQIEKAYRTSTVLLEACYSAASMWAANCATVSPSPDTEDQRLHFTAANQISQCHRHQEAAFNHHLLQRVFPDERYFKHHPPLPASLPISDEGAANHNRLCVNQSSPGIHLFVYGREGFTHGAQSSAQKYYPRHTLEASQAIARNHRLHPERLVFAKQNPAVIDLGVFHHDVIGVANEQVLLLHEYSFSEQHKVLATLQGIADFNLIILEVKNTDISVKDAVSSYLFNSQLITMPSGDMMLISPIECNHIPAIKQYIENLIADDSNPISAVHYTDLKQSMQNGGGPACLRLRVPLSGDALKHMHQGVLINDSRLFQLETWVKHHYRDTLNIDDLRDPALMDESFCALDELTRILCLGTIYPFQR